MEEDPMNHSSVLPRYLALPRAFWKRILVWMVFWNVVPLVLLYFLIGTIAADKMTKPRRVFTASYTPALLGLPYEDVQFAAKDGQAQIAAWYVPSVENTRAVVVVHGRNASRTELFLGHSIDLARALHEAGFSVLLIDLRGHGQSSDGRFTFGLQERYDVEGAVDWLAVHGYQPGQIAVMGVSMGSAAAIGAAAEDERIGALVSDSGYAEVRSLIQSRWTEETSLPDIFLPSTRLMIRLKYGYDITASRPVEDLRAVAPRPILLIHCSNDLDIPYAQVQQLQAAAPSAQLWTIPTCLHGQSYNANPAAYEDHLIPFLMGSLR
jgi:pimeloyl-ACP methyl ester carboxylesterase